MATRRTTQRSTAGRKLYAVRDAKGRYEDIQTYERAHGQDVKRKSKAELAKAAKPAKKTATRTGATRKGTTGRAKTGTTSRGRGGRKA